VVHSASSEERLKAQYPDADVVRGDMSRAEDAKRILSDVTSVLYIGPSLASREAEMGFTMIDAAYQESQQGALKHFVYSSVLHPQIRKLLNHDCKRYVEEYLIESGLNYTIVQPSHEIRRPVKTVQRNYYESVESFEKAISGNGGGVPRATRDALQRLLLYYNFYGIKGNPNVLEWLIGRKPTTVKDFLHQKVLDCQGS
jgi:hypothetical protein